MVIGYGLVVGYPGRPSCSLGIGIGYPGLSTCSLGKVVASYRRFVLSAHYSRSYSTFLQHSRRHRRIPRWQRQGKIGSSSENRSSTIACESGTPVGWCH